MNINQLHKLFLECNSVCTDTRKIKNNDLFFALKGENFNGNQFANKALENGAKYAVVDEEQFAKDSNAILVDDVLQTLQQLATYHRQYLKIPILALTGSNGKTTTKELLKATLSQKFKTIATVGNLNNHIGVPLTLLSMDSDTEIGIVEMGANHLKEIEFLCNIANPDYGYITNYGKAHLEGFGSIEGVIEGKSEMYNYLISNSKTIFVNGDDKIQMSKVKEYKNIYSFCTKTNSCNTITNLESSNPFVVTKYNNLIINSHLLGDYNFNNISAAICIANFFNVPDENIKKGIENYKPSNNRSQIIKKGNIKIVLDAYNANPTSMILALNNFSQLEDTNKIAILGDMFELGKLAKVEHQNIADYASTLNIKAIFLVGELFNTTKNNSSQIIFCKTFEILKDKLKNIDLDNSTLLIKGSRGMALERILDIIV